MPINKGLQNKFTEGECSNQNALVSKTDIKVHNIDIYHIDIYQRLRQEDCHEFKTGLHSETRFQTNNGRTKPQKSQRLPGGGLEEAGTPLNS